MKSIHKAVLVICFLTTFFFFPFAEANKIKYSLLKEAPALQSDPLLHWWWDKDPKDDPTAFKMDNILDLEKNLNEAILGQSFAITEVTNNLISYQAGINDPNKPIGVFLFAGPTGVGKTQLAKELSKALLGSEVQMTRFDMGEYATEATIWTLIGSSRGYLDSHKGGTLTEAVRNRKNSIILLDEIEKAAPEVRKLFLSVFDEGRITSGTGEVFNLNSSLFILTTNIASEEILELSNNNLDNVSILRQIEGRIAAYLSPELYNRVTPIIFKAIPYELYPKIIDRELYLISKRLLKLKQLQLTFDPSVNQYLFESLKSNHLGVRPLKRLIEQQIIGNLSRFIVTQHPQPESNILITIEGDYVTIKE